MDNIDPHIVPDQTFFQDFSMLLVSSNINLFCFESLRLNFLVSRIERLFFVKFVFHLRSLIILHLGLSFSFLFKLIINRKYFLHRK